jgi:SAM-dependent methyltransferase
MPPLYGDDVSYIHDRGFAWYAEEATPGILNVLRRHGIRQGLVVDLGCGSGHFLQQAMEAGYDAVGLDRSEAMIHQARRTAPGGSFFVADLRTAAIPRCAAVTSMGEVLSYVFAADARARALGRLFRRVFRALDPGGLFVFDVGAPGRELGGMPTRGHWLGPDWAVMVDAELDANTGRLTRHLVSFRKRGNSYRRTEEVHDLRLYHPDTIHNALTTAGFVSRQVRGFGQLRFRSGHIGFVACKPLG